MKFLTGVELYKAVKNIFLGENPSFAVAFWGQGSEHFIIDIN